MSVIAAGLKPDTAPDFSTAIGNCAMPDPLDHDMPSDDVVVTTRRGMVRVALVATEVAARFQREGVNHDPMAWMIAPRSLFSGAAAIDACTDRDACLRGVLIHGLSLGLDADPDVIDELVADDADHADDPDADDGSSAPSRDAEASGEDGAGKVVRHFPSASSGKPRLFTATVVTGDGREAMQAFHASIACDEEEVFDRLHRRVGPASAKARIVAGFDPTDPLVGALVSSAICDTLRLVASDPTSPLAAGLDLNVEQRFLN